MDGLLLVVAGDDDGEHQVVGDAEDPQLAAEGLAQGLDQPLQAFGVAGEAADGRIEARPDWGGPSASCRDGGGVGDGGRRAYIHRVRILPARLDRSPRRGFALAARTLGGGAAGGDRRGSLRFRISDGPGQGKADRAADRRAVGHRARVATPEMPRAASR